jgi:LysR family transcriptional regulator of gallate degradation
MGSTHLPLLADLKPLRAACAVYALGSTVQAARALRVAQSSITRAIQDLEASCGHLLFLRMGRGMQPTPEGLPFLARGARALGFLAVLGGPEGRTGLHALSWLVSRFATGLNQRHMRALLALGRSLTLAGAARDLGVGASAVHQTLSQLEHVAGAALFVRSRRSLRLTEAGEQALHAVKLALAELEQAEQDLSWRKGFLRGSLVIGTLPFSTGLLLPQAVESVLSAHPGLSITIVDGTYDALVRRLRAAEIDIMLGALRPQAPAELRQETLFEDRLAVVARGGHPLSRRAGLAWADLAGAQWILPMLHTPAQVAFEQALASAGLQLPPSSLRVNSALMMQTLLAETDRLALMSPRQVWRELQAGLLVELPVRVQHAPRPIGMALRESYLPAPGAELMLERLRSLGRRLEGQA